MTAIDPKLIQKRNFDNAIRTCQTQCNKFTNDPVRQAKYNKMLEELKDAKKKLDNAIKATKNIDIVVDATTTSPTTTKFYDAYIAASEDTVTLDFLESKLSEEKTAGRVAEDTELDTKTNDVELKVDFIDRTKQGLKDIFDGKGLSNGLVGACVGVGIGELLAKGVTSVLVKQGIMQSSMGLFGLAKLGVTNLPGLWSAISSGATALWGFSPVVAVAMAGVAALKLIPAVKHLKDKVVGRVKSANQLETDLDEMIKKQKEHEEPTGAPATAGAS